METPFDHATHPGIDTAHQAVDQVLQAEGIVIGPPWLRTILQVLLQILTLGHQAGLFRQEPPKVPPTVG
jgi:hypothetical protein